MTEPLSPAIESAIERFWAATADYWADPPAAKKLGIRQSDAKKELRAAILAEQQSLIGRIERLSARLDECERGVVEP